MAHLEVGNPTLSWSALNSLTAALSPVASSFYHQWTGLLLDS